jgi:tagaturonate reductase
VAAEYYYLFVIQGPAWVGEELKLAGANLNVKLVDDITPYKKRKVGILNGGHTTLVPVALLAGLEAVGPAVDDEGVGASCAPPSRTKSSRPSAWTARSWKPTRTT